MSEPPALDIVLLLVRRKYALLICIALGGAVGLAYGLLAPPWYSARLTVVPSQRTSNPAMGMLANFPGADALGASTSTDVQRIQAVLTSNSVSDEVIKKFDLEDRYGASHLEQARSTLWEHCGVGVDRKSGVVALTCEDKVPEQAMQIAAYFGEVGNRVFGRISASSAREERKFLESQVVKARKDVDDSSSALREFQEQHRIIDLGEQSKAVISAMASIEGELVSKQLQLSYLSSFSSRTEANVAQLQEQIGIMEAKLKQLEDSHPEVLTATGGSGMGSGSGTGSADPKFFPNAMRVPELRFQLEQLFRQQKISETVFMMLTQRFETAKVDEARDTSTFQILDNPTLPTYKSRPQRSKIAAYGLVGGLAFGAAWILVPVWWRRRTLLAS
jgi:capsule polysaccharide export protein KpsE/RkpR